MQNIVTMVTQSNTFGLTYGTAIHDKAPEIL